jgi:CBS domain-containing protein
MSTVGQLLRSKRPGTWTIGPQASVYQALELMAEKDIGAVLVVDQERLEGIFSERDYARKVVLRGRTSRETTVGELMTQALYYVTPEQTVEECLAVMTDKHIRHLPVLDHSKLVGLVSIGDAVKSIIDEQELTIQHLETYITGSAVTRTSRT